jgi:polygalacturonase
VLFFPAGVYLTGTVLMQSNVKLYVDAGALIRGSRKSADYVSPPMPAGARPLRALVVFNKSILKYLCLAKTPSGQEIE